MIIEKDMPKEVYWELNQDVLRPMFEEFLIHECGYNAIVASESDDWRDERLEVEYKIALSNIK